MGQEEWLKKVISTLVTYGFNEAEAQGYSSNIYDTYYKEYPNEPEEAVLEELSNWND